MDALQPGQVLGSFRIVRQLGAGGMGTVYEAEHLRLPVRRALKVFSSESVHVALLRKRFLAEGKILSSLQHPRIVRVYDLIVDDETGLAYFEMDLVCSPDGEPQTLAQAHERGVGEDEIKTWFEDVCEGLAYIHSKGVIHRDISADNILIGPDGHAVISDFGIAKIIDEEYRKKIDVTVTMVTPNGIEFRMGKERYMSPELKAKNGKASFASDAWALGVTFFWMLSGSWYDVGTRLEDSLAIFDYNWAPVIAQLCNKNPTDRLPEGGIGNIPKLLLTRGLGRSSAQEPWARFQSYRRRTLYLLFAVVGISFWGLFWVLRFVWQHYLSKWCVGVGDAGYPWFLMVLCGVWGLLIVIAVWVFLRHCILKSLSDGVDCVLGNLPVDRASSSPWSVMLVGVWAVIVVEIIGYILYFGAVRRFSGGLIVFLLTIMIEAIAFWPSRKRRILRALCGVAGVFILIGMAIAIRCL